MVLSRPIRSTTAVVVYVALMTTAGVAAFLITFLRTDSIWWALLAMLVAGPVAQVVLRVLGLPNPRPERPRRS
jgi:hypothetical protein